MAVHEYLLCDNPTCTSEATLIQDADLTVWAEIRLVRAADDEGTAITVEGHACHRDCIPTASAALAAGLSDG